MTTSEKKLSIFVSYSHVDRRWLDRLKVHLKAVERDFEVELWDDTRISLGNKWRHEIKEAINKCNIAILLISADFLASDFIAKHELPPLLVSADAKGTQIIPIIVKPSLFRRKQDLAQFQATNFPTQPLISMDENAQENVFAKLAEIIWDKAKSWSNVSIYEEPHQPIIEKSEDFFLENTWIGLIKIGNWIFDSDTRTILGEGRKSYLLSSECYENDFCIDCSVEFSKIEYLSDAALVGFNAGIVLGWNDKGNGFRYYNLLITGKYLLFEKIGFQRGVEGDYKHLTSPVPFQIEKGVKHDFSIESLGNKLVVKVDKQELINIDRPAGLSGRVGLRPWRSQMKCHKFVVK